MNQTSSLFLPFVSISSSNLEDRALLQLQQKQREEAERQRMLDNPDAALLIAAKYQQSQVCMLP
jgi:hypothetical protein